MKTLIVFCVILACVAAASLEKCSSEEYTEYLEFKKKFNSPAFDQDVEGLKCVIWRKNKVAVKLNNAIKETHKLGINHLSALTPVEYNAMLGLNVKDVVRRDDPILNIAASGDLPKSWDWRTQNLVSSVKNQGACGSCWAFASVGALEGQVKKKNSKVMTELSEQNIADCTYKMGINGCDGGWIGNAYDAATKAGGVFKSQFYSYKSGKSGKTGTCQFVASQTAKIGVKVTGYNYVWSSDAALKAAVYNIGPIAVGVDADGFGGYKSGVYKNPKCNKPSNINHAMLVVGYDTDANGQDYWIVKNSW